MKPGVYLDLTEQEYNAIPAVRSSDLRRFMRATPAHYHYEMQREQPQKDCFDLGRALHIAVLEPDTFADRVRTRRPMPTPAELGLKDSKGNPATGFRTSQHRDLKRCIEQNIASEVAGAEVVLDPDQMESVTEMSNSLDSNPEFAAFLDLDHQTEVTVVWVDERTGTPCKARLDMWIPSLRTIVEVKQTRVQATVERFSREIYRYGYHQQASWYCEAARAHLGGVSMLSPVQFAVVENSRPHLSVVRSLDFGALALGRRECMEALEKLAECERTGRWPGHDPDEDFALPGWCETEDLGIEMPDEDEA